MKELREHIIASMIIWVPLFIFWADVIQAHLFNFYLGAFVCLALSFMSTGRPELSNPWLTLFLLFVAGWFSFWLSGHYVGQKTVRIVLVGLDIVLILIAAIVIYREVATSSKPKEFWFNYICFSALIQAFISICQYWWFNPVYEILSLVTTVSYSSWGDAHTPAGSLVNTNYLGAFIAIPLPLFFRGSFETGPIHKMIYRLRWYMLSSVIIYALYISSCRTAIVAVLAVAAFWIWEKGPEIVGAFRQRLERFCRPAIIILFIAAVSWFVSKNTGSFVERYNEFWAGPLKLWIGNYDAPTWAAWYDSFYWHIFIFGIGPGVSFRVNNFLHSEWAPMIQNFGLIGAGLMIAYAVRMLRLSWQTCAALLSSLIIILVDCLGNHLFHIPGTALMGVFILALIEKSNLEA